MSRQNGIEVIDKHGWRKVYPLPAKPIIHIGSHSRNDIILTNEHGAGVAPLHAQLIAPGSTGAGYRLVNLAESDILLTPTGEQTLPARSAVVLATGQSFIVGDYTLVFQGEGGAYGVPASNHSTHLGLRLTFSQTNLAPNQFLEGVLTVTNLSQQASVQFELDLEGLDPACYDLEPGPLLSSGAEKDIFLRVHHRGGKPVASDCRITIRAAAPKTYPGETVTVSQMIQVLPFYRHKVRLLPPDGSAEPFQADEADLLTPKIRTAPLPQMQERPVTRPRPAPVSPPATGRPVSPATAPPETGPPADQADQWSTPAQAETPPSTSPALSQPDNQPDWWSAPPEAANVPQESAVEAEPEAAITPKVESDLLPSTIAAVPDEAENRSVPETAAEPEQVIRPAPQPAPPPPSPVFPQEAITDVQTTEPDLPPKPVLPAPSPEPEPSASASGEAPPPEPEPKAGSWQRVKAWGFDLTGRLPFWQKRGPEAGPPSTPFETIEPDETAAPPEISPVEIDAPPEIAMADSAPAPVFEPEPVSEDEPAPLPEIDSAAGSELEPITEQVDSQIQPEDEIPIPPSPEPEPAPETGNLTETPGEEPSLSPEPSKMTSPPAPETEADWWTEPPEEEPVPPPAETEQSISPAETTTEKMETETEADWWSMPPVPPAVDSEGQPENLNPAATGQEPEPQAGTEPPETPGGAPVEPEPGTGRWVAAAAWTPLTPGRIPPPEEEEAWWTAEDESEEEEDTQSDAGEAA